MRIGSDFEPGVLNRLVAVDGTNDRLVNDIVMDPLVEADQHWHMFPQLATEVPTVANGGVRVVGGKLYVTVGVRAAATWSDGVPITCRDVQFTFETMRDKRWLITSKIGWDQLQAVRCLTPHRAQLVFSHPYASFMRVLQSAPLPEHELRGKNFNTYWNNAITVSSGPFRFERWERGKRIVLVRNDHYWKRGAARLPLLDRITIEFYRNPNTLDIQLSSGRVDLINRALEARASQESQIFPRSQYLVTPGTGIEHLGFNTGKGPLHDVRVRQAVAYAIDRPRLARDLLGKPFSIVDSTLLREQGPYFAADFQRYRLHPGRVRRLLTAAGYVRKGRYWERDGKRLSLVFKSVAGKPLRLRIAQVIQEQLRAQGIDVSIALEQPQVFFGGTLASGSFDIAQWGFGIGVDPEQRFYFACHPSKGKDNAYRFCDHRLERLIDQGDTTIDVARRAAISHRFQALIAKDIPLLPLYQHVDLVLLGSQVRGVVPNPQAGVAWNAERWWLQR